MSNTNSFNSLRELNIEGRTFAVNSISEAESNGGLTGASKLPRVMKNVLLGLLAREGNGYVTQEDILIFADWVTEGKTGGSMKMFGNRVITQDLTAVPFFVDLCCLSEKAIERGLPDQAYQPQVPIITYADHSAEVDAAGEGADAQNRATDIRKNVERYAFLNWAAETFDNCRFVQPGKNICHQGHLENDAEVIALVDVEGVTFAIPDTAFTLDSHGPHVNGASVTCFGIGGIEAVGTLYGQPYVVPTPEVIGIEFVGALQPGVSSYQLSLHMIDILRKEGVVGKFVEGFGPGLKTLTVPNRCAVSNTAPEQGGTLFHFPIDEQTMVYLRTTAQRYGEDAEIRLALVEQYAKLNGLWYSDDMPVPQYTKVIRVDLSTIFPSAAGPDKPEDRVPITGLADRFKQRDMPAVFGRTWEKRKTATLYGETVSDGVVGLAMFAACTSSSDEDLGFIAGITARKAVARGLKFKPWVKGAATPGSEAARDILIETGLMDAMNRVGMGLAGIGCYGCIGGSGKLNPELQRVMNETGIEPVAKVSTNRPFSQRVNNLIKANYLESPEYVIAYGIAGRIDIDLENEPIGYDAETGHPVFFHEIKATAEEVLEVKASIAHRRAAIYRETYARIDEDVPGWEAVRQATPVGKTYPWNSDSILLQPANYLDGFTIELPTRRNVSQARTLVQAAPSTTTDGVAPAAKPLKGSPAYNELIHLGVQPANILKLGQYRGNIGLLSMDAFGGGGFKNLLTPGSRGSVSKRWDNGEVLSVWDLAMVAISMGVDVFVLADALYKKGSSRDVAAKVLLALKVFAEVFISIERIARSNDICMGVMPIELTGIQSLDELNLDGTESYDFVGLDAEPSVGMFVEILVHRTNGETQTLSGVARIDTDIECQYIRHGGMLPFILRGMIEQYAA